MVHVIEPPGRDVDSGVRLAEVVGAIALAADLGLGQPLEHMLRSCTIATRLAERLELTPEEREATYWVTLFTTAGCTGVSYELASLFGDDIAFRSGFFELGGRDIDAFRYLMSVAGGECGVVGRTKVRLDLLRTRMGPLEQSLLAHCGVSAELAQRLDLGDQVVSALRNTFERWDGKGLPHKLRGEEVGRPIQIANMANMLEARAREHGVEAACALAREVSGRIVEPALVDAFCTHAEDLVAGLDDESSWERVVLGAPAGRGPLTEDELDDALELFADYADLKAPCFIGHSRGVAGLAEAAAREAGLPDQDCIALRRAALLHDIGRNGVPNTIWDKPGPLTDGQMERVRLHAYYTDRVLSRAGRLSALASIASAAHERSEGAGYPRGTAVGSIPVLGRFLAAADAYHAMIEDRPHRTALSADAAAAELRRAARTGELDGTAVDSVLSAAGHPVRRRPTAPAGLTPREIEVLVLAARGGTTRAVASRLGISPKTAGNHLERIYSKIGVSSRAEAAMFAMHHGLLPSWQSSSA